MSNIHSWRPGPAIGAALLLCLLGLGGALTPPAEAGPLLDRWRARQEGEAGRPAPAGTHVLRDVPYGADRAQSLDVYLQDGAIEGAPIILMFHGGGWKHGDKSMMRSVDAKVERWVRRGFIFVSANYRLLPEAPVDVQLRDVGRALAAVQEKAASWGGDRRRVILMGHSAGAHLVALLSANPKATFEPGTAPVLGTVALDSAAMDVVQIMEAKHYGLYDAPFGKDKAYWTAMSPFHTIVAGAAPLLAVCSSRRDESCGQARKHTERARWLGNRAEVLPEDLNHGEINSELGLASPYTEAVERFMASLDNDVARRLGR